MNYLRNIKFNTSHIYYFIIYSLIGWCIETSYVSITQGKFVNRGIFHGPFCPIYGFGALILLLLLEPVKNKCFLFFTGSVLLTSSLEYTTGYVMRVYFNTIAWDYSSEILNLHGIISLKFSLIWGVLAVVFLNYLHPHIDRMVYLIPIHYRSMVCCLILIFFMIDTMIVFTFQYDIFHIPDVIPSAKQFSEKLYDCGVKCIKIIVND